MGHSTGLWLYLALTDRTESFAARKLAMRVRRGSESPQRATERLGHISMPRPKGPLVWFHTAGAHAARHVQTLIGRMGLEREDAHFLVTTASGGQMDEVEPHFAERTFHQYAPYEVGPAVRRFLDHWQPDLAFWVGSELWPTLISETEAHGVPLYLIDAHMSQETHFRWRWIPGVAASLLRRFRLILAAERRTEIFLRRLGMDPDRIEVTGPLDEGNPALPCNETERLDLAAQIGTRPVWLAAHVEEAEEEAVIAAHRRAGRHSPRLLLILVPQDPTRGAVLGEELEATGWRIALRDREGTPDPDTQIFVAESDDEMGLWYRLAPITFLGQSLTPTGGSNPYEPAALGSALVHGPNVENFQLDYRRLEAASATRRVRNGDALGIAIEDLLMPDRNAEMVHAAWEVTSRGAEVTDRIIELMTTVLDARDRR